MAGKAIASAAVKKGVKYGVEEAMKKRKKKVRLARPPDMTFEEELGIRRALGLL